LDRKLVRPERGGKGRTSFTMQYNSQIVIVKIFSVHYYRIKNVYEDEPAPDPYKTSWRNAYLWGTFISQVIERATQSEHLMLPFLTVYLTTLSVSTIYVVGW
jgi:hypothetical protein